MKAKILISYYPSEGGHKVHRVYLEPDFKQAQKDLDLMMNEASDCKSWELQECELHNFEKITHES